VGDPVVLEVRDRVAVITLDRPPLNLFDVAMRDALLVALLAVRDLPGVGATVLRSSGRHFGAGADLSEFGSADHVLEARRIRWDRDPWGPLVELPVPTIAAIDGVALGSAMEMALLCDLRICSADARLGLPEIGLGMLPGAGGTQSLARCIGPVDALPLIATGVQLSAREALDRGVVHRVVAATDLDDEVMSVANDLARLPSTLLRAVRRSLRAATDLPLDAGLRVEGGQARAGALASISPSK
jgi:enoyl-CoA hydratase/carnithine racemase